VLVICAIRWHQPFFALRHASFFTYQQLMNSLREFLFSLGEKYFLSDSEILFFSCCSLKLTARIHDRSLLLVHLVIPGLFC
jgi:hypothetical protein